MNTISNLGEQAALQFGEREVREVCRDGLRQRIGGIPGQGRFQSRQDRAGSQQQPGRARLGPDDDIDLARDRLDGFVLQMLRQLVFLPVGHSAAPVDGRALLEASGLVGDDVVKRRLVKTLPEMVQFDQMGFIRGVVPAGMQFQGADTAEGGENDELVHDGRYGNSPATILPLDGNSTGERPMLNLCKKTAIETMKRYFVHEIGQEPKVIQADTCTIDSEPREIRFYRGAELLEVYYLHALRRPVRELPPGKEEGEEEPVVIESPVGPEW